MVDTFNQQMNILEKRLDNRVTVLEDKTNESINHVEFCVKYQMSNITEKTGKEIEVVQEICKSQEIVMEVYESRLDELEQYSRRNAVRLLGVEENSVEDCEKISREILKDRLAVDIKIHQIDRAHRVGRKQQEGTRDILIKFTSYRYKKKVIEKRCGLKGSGLMLVEDLTRSRAKLLKKTLECSRVQFAWTADGRILAKLKDSTDIVPVTSVKNLPR